MPIRDHARLNSLAVVAGKGDRDTLEWLLEEINPYIVRICRSVCINKGRVDTLARINTALGRAEDLAQETMLKLVTSIHLYNPDKGNFLTWVYHMAAMLNYDELRRQRILRDQIGLKHSLETIESLGDHMTRGRTATALSLGGNYLPAWGEIGLEGSNPEHAIIHMEQAREGKEACRRAMAKLPERQRLAVTMHYFDNIPCEDIAVIMGCSRQAVKSLLFNARNNMRPIVNSALHRAA